MIFVLTVFVLFVCCLLAAVLAFAKAYKHFGSEIEKRFDTATAQTLVLQKLRSYDSGAVSVGKQGDTDYLGFSDTIDIRHLPFRSSGSSATRSAHRYRLLRS